MSKSLKSVEFILQILSKEGCLIFDKEIFPFCEPKCKTTDEYLLAMVGWLMEEVVRLRSNDASTNYRLHPSRFPTKGFIKS